MTISAAADEESINHNPGPVGISALSNTPSTRHFFADFLDVAQRFFLDRGQGPPAMLPLVGCESDKSLVL